MTSGLEASEPDGLPPVLPLRAITAPQPGRPTALLITDEDCRVEDFALSALDIRTTATLATSTLRSPLPVAEDVVAFEAGALADAAARSGHSAQSLQAHHPALLADWAAAAGATQIATPYVTIGPLRDWLTEAAPTLAARGITLCECAAIGTARSGPTPPPGFSRSNRTSPASCSRSCPPKSAPQGQG